MKEGTCSVLAAIVDLNHTVAMTSSTIIPALWSTSPRPSFPSCVCWLALAAGSPGRCSPGINTRHAFHASSSRSSSRSLLLFSYSSYQNHIIPSSVIYLNLCDTRETSTAVSPATSTVLRHNHHSAHASPALHSRLSLTYCVNRRATAAYQQSTP